LAREPWLFEEVEAGAWTGRAQKSQTLRRLRSSFHSVLEQAFNSLTPCIWDNSG
jgi:hypothetical protein